MVYSLNIALEVFSTSYNGKGDFLESLNIEDGSEGIVIDKFLGGQGNLTGFISFFTGSAPNFSGENPEEELMNSANSHLLRVASWLNQRREAIVNRSENLDLTMNFQFWDDANHIELTLPSEFLVACGEAKIKIVVASND